MHMSCLKVKGIKLPLLIVYSPTLPSNIDTWYINVFVFLKNHTILVELYIYPLLWLSNYFFKASTICSDSAPWFVIMVSILERRENGGGLHFKQGLFFCIIPGIIEYKIIQQVVLQFHKTRYYAMKIGWTQVSTQ